MNATNRIIFNTIILYIKIIICMAISLWTVPIVLRALGVEEYGLFNLLAGVIAMLSFLNASMTISTQRYLSIAKGEKNEEKFNSVFNASIFIHILIGFIVATLFEICAPFLFDGLLNIAPEKRTLASEVYQILIVNMFFIIVTVPYNAVLNAHENMLPFSIISIIDAIIKIGLAYFILYIENNRLIVYSFGMMGVTFFTLVTTALYTHLRYPSLRFKPRQYRDKDLFYQMLSFCGWNTFGGFAMACRNQGIAIVLNLFYGTFVNAAYGIANQINGVLSYFSATIQKSINPQLMMSAGEQNNEKRVALTYSLSKYSTLILAVVAIPLIIEMPTVLQLWLKDVPENTIIFTRLILLLSILYQLSSGLMSAIQATGKIRNYQVIVSSIIILNIPISYGVLALHADAYSAFIILIVMELVCLVYRIWSAKKIAHIPVRNFCKQIILPLAIVLGTTYVLLYCFTIYVEASILRVVATSALSVLITACGTWLGALNQSEKEWVISLVKKSTRK